MEPEITGWEVSLVPSVAEPGEKVSVKVRVYAGPGDTKIPCFARIYWIDGTRRRLDFYVYPETGGSAVDYIYVPSDAKPGTYNVKVELYKYTTETQIVAGVVV